jgi:hypothetical protein
MIKTSVIVLAFAVLAFSANVFTPEDSQGIKDFVTGFIKTSGLPISEDSAESCIQAITGLGDNEFLQGLNADDVTKAQLVLAAANAFEYCSSSFEDSINVLNREVHMLNNNFDLYFDNAFENREELIQLYAGMIKAFGEENFFKAGRKAGKIFNVVFGKHNPAIRAIRKETINQINIGTLNPDDNGVFKLLDNATLFVEGYGNGFDIDNQAQEVYDTEVGGSQLVNCTKEFIANLTKGGNLNDLLDSLTCAWNGFSNVTIDGTESVQQLAYIYQPVIQLAEKNVTQVQVDFENNLKASPLKAGFDLVAFKTDLKVGNMFGAGNAAGELSTIGLKGLVNIPN